MKIKTIKETVPKFFDEHVNKYLDEGWTIYRLSSYKDSGRTTLIAFLTKDFRQPVDLGPV